MKTLIIFPFFYIKEVIVGVVQVAFDVIRPNPQLDPIVFELAVVELRPKQRLILACLISMTPGTLAIGEDDDGDTMLIHSLYGGSDTDAAIAHLVRHYYPFVKLLPI